MSAAPGPLPLALSVVVPAFNEAEIIDDSVRHIVDGLRERGAEFEVIIIENGSADRTRTLADQLSAEYPEVRSESRREADYGGALRHGFLAAVGTIVVNFDCDYYDLGFLDDSSRLIAAADGPDIVVGSKRADGATDTRPALRRLVTMVFSFVLRHIFGLHVSDTHGMKALRRSAVEPHVRHCRFGRDLFDTELILRCERAGLATAEIPVSVVEMRPARTSILRRVPRTLVGLARLRVALWREHQ